MILEFGNWSLEFGDWNLEIGDWKLEFRNWSPDSYREEFGDWIANRRSL